MLPEVKKLMRGLIGQGASRIHLIGVGGAGMSGIARLLLALGHEVTGSDLRRTAEIERLEDMGAKIFKGHDAGQVEGAALVVFSSAIRPENPERERAEASNIPCARRAECLAVLAEMKKAIVVAGMHGKTTTASMLAFVMQNAGEACSHYIGAEVPILGACAAWGEGSYFIIEGDESDGTVQLYHPANSILLNVEEEHLDHYGTLGKIMETFGRLLSQTTDRIIYCADDKNSLLLCSHRDNAIGYGFSEAGDYRIFDVDQEQFRSTFKLLRGGTLLGELEINVPGKQNVANAAGVAAMCCELGMDWENIVAGLREFRGAKRRFEVKSKSKDFMVVDDYAHHPTEIKATLAAASNSGWKRVIALFQPHRYTRTKLLLKDFGSAFADADAVYLTGIYAASEQPMRGVTGEALAEEIRGNGHPNVAYASTLSQLHSVVSRAVEPGDLILTMGAGDIHQVATALANELDGYQALRETLKPASVLRRQEPMSKHTTMRIGGPADLWFEPVDEEDLAKGLRYASTHDIPVTLIGRGSNLLVLDGGIRGLCVHLGQDCFSKIEIDGATVRAGAGVRLKKLVLECKKAGLGGFEFMEGIPGNIGGAIRMNAGAMKGWTMDVIKEVRTMDPLGNIHTVPADELEIFYRSVPYFRENIAIAATLEATPSDDAKIDALLKEFSKHRWGSQPAASCAGCIFKNPEEIPAGKLIQELGLKDRAIGPARVSEVHGNFIVNDGGACADDVLALIDIIKAEAREKRHIELNTEVIILGETK